MSLLLFLRAYTIPPPIDPEPGDAKLRNRVGIKGIYTRAMSKGEKVTLEQAIELLKANW